MIYVLGSGLVLLLVGCVIHDLWWVSPDEARRRAEEDRADRNRRAHDLWDEVRGHTYPHELADGSYHWYPTDYGRAVRLRRAASRS